MKIYLRITTFVIIATLIFSVNMVFADSSSNYTNQKVGDISVKSITIDMNNNAIKPILLNANNQMTATDSLANMAANVGAFAAINGTYFEAYSGTPVPWGTLIKNGKVLHISQSGSVVGITSSGRLLIDRLSFDFEGYINGEFRAIPWRINHPSVEPDAITIFTSEYGDVASVLPGAKAVVVIGGKVTQIATSDFYVPTSGFAIIYNPAVAYLVDQRYKIGDEVYYNVKINTTFTNTNDWNDVAVGLGAGPSLIIGGNVTAQGEIEGFSEAKINTNRASRSFIGAKADGTIIIGNMASATLMQAATTCQSMGLVNAMCLDGGGSVALYYPSSSVSIGGRNINNGLAFVGTTPISVPEEQIAPTDTITATPTASKVQVNGKTVAFDNYIINGNSYFKLRDLAISLNETTSKFEVEWSQEAKAINIVTKKSYNAVGGELSKGSGRSEKALPSNSKIYKDGVQVNLLAYSINGYTYFKLRDIAKELNIGVFWNGATSTINIDTSADYLE